VNVKPQKYGMARLSKEYGVGVSSIKDISYDKTWDLGDGYTGDNIRDWNKLPARGENHANGRLTESEVLEIRSLYVPYSREFGSSPLGKRYGVSGGSIRCIISRRAWKHI